jgi:nucleoside phosphorylase
VVVVVAHAFEARSAAGVGRHMSKEGWGLWTLYRGEMWDIPLAVIRCGPGKVVTAAATQAAIQYLDPVLILSFGTAICPDPGVDAGTIVAPTVVVDAALSAIRDLPVSTSATFHPDAALQRYLVDVPGTRAGTLVCWEGRTTSPGRGLHAGSDLVLVDWESAGVAQVARMWGVPWAALKVVSDHGEEERLRYLALAAKRPLQWAAEVMRRACNQWLEERRLQADGPERLDGGADGGRTA